MTKKEQIEEMARDICRVKQNCNDVCHPINSCRALKYAERFYNAGYRKQSENETLEAVDMFRNLIVNRFIELCNYNDYGKINLLLIGETIDRIYDDVIAKMKGGAE